MMEEEEAAALEARLADLRDETRSAEDRLRVLRRRIAGRRAPADADAGSARDRDDDGDNPFAEREGGPATCPVVAAATDEGRGPGRPFGPAPRKRKRVGKRIVYLCAREGCERNAQKGGICIGHGAPRGKYVRCSVEGCGRVAQRRDEGLCVGHGGTRPPRRECSRPGCARHVVSDGVCLAHGATRRQVRPTCSVEGCASQARHGGVCMRHGASYKRPRCRVEGCDNQSVRGGVCKRHGAKLINLGENSMPLRRHPKYGEYFRMVDDQGVRRHLVENLMKERGLDPKVLDLDPDRSMAEHVEEGYVATVTMKGCSGKQPEAAENSA